jgi:hypothetical protein
MGRAAVIALAVAVLALSPAGCGGDRAAESAAEETTAQDAGEPVTVELEEMNDSGYTGTATLKPIEGTIPTFEAVVTVTPPSPNPQLVAIHRVTCGRYDPEIPAGASLDVIFEAVSETTVNELGEVREGKTRTTASGSLAERTKGGHSIIVHDNAPPYRPVACGDMPES